MNSLILLTTVLMGVHAPVIADSTYHLETYNSSYRFHGQRIIDGSRVNFERYIFDMEACILRSQTYIRNETLTTDNDRWLLPRYHFTMAPDYSLNVCIATLVFYNKRRINNYNRYNHNHNHHTLNNSWYPHHRVRVHHNHNQHRRRVVVRPRVVVHTQNNHHYGGHHKANHHKTNHHKTNHHKKHAHKKHAHKRRHHKRHHRTKPRVH